MLDFNQAEQQSAGTGGAIPPESVIPFKMTIRPPKAGKEGTQHPMFSRSSKGNEYIDVEFEALGTYAGRKIWQNFTLFGSDQAAKISMRTMRAIVESARGISATDASPQAAAGRQLSDWADFNGMTFLAKVKCVVEKSQKDGQYYVNNEITKIITPDMEEYAAGEHITDKPLPLIPDGPEPAAATAAPAWGAPAAQPAAALPTMPPPAAPQAAPMPVWAAR
jgi:hypothetical protein